MRVLFSSFTWRKNCVPKRHSGKISNHFVLCPAAATFAFSWRKIQKFKKTLDDITENVIHCNTEGGEYD